MANPKRVVNLIKITILQSRIDVNNINNFNKTGFAIGLTATTKVIMGSKYYGRRALSQPRNRE